MTTTILTRPRGIPVQHPRGLVGRHRATPHTQLQPNPPTAPGHRRAALIAVIGLTALTVAITIWLLAGLLLQLGGLS